MYLEPEVTSCRKREVKEIRLDSEPVSPIRNVTGA